MERGIEALLTVYAVVEGEGRVTVRVFARDMV